MNLRLIIVLAFLICVSCEQKDKKEFFDKECISKKLNEVNINADIQVVNNKLIKLILKKPYRIVDESHQQLLLEFLIPCFYNENPSQNIDFIIALDKEVGQYESEFYFIGSDILHVLKKDSKLKKMHKYILKEFDNKDMIVLNNFITGFYDSYPYKDDIYNVKLLQLLEYLKDEKNDNDKAKLTFLLLYGTSKESKAKDLKGISRHLKTIWNMIIKSDIDKVLSENFD